ncbi:protein FAR1-RELATED SEQUENCE 2-like [Olea europaea var. sylvestris]|uniref:protein FAR1-RELATED SEQUENCE 2-like n=1 Tax=Olea europaea var. sylvestris TaxID=158386 RepID=UPI000C1D1197|nr:protein FAR1-RELATED SEQUENCE 2-like [Olea europaea var. sylvestris]
MNGCPYERTLRNKVEKEFHADFKSFSQMVPCATLYEMEKQVQALFTISKFREFQDEITGKVYCDVISMSDGCSERIYEVEEDVIYEDKVRKKKFTVWFRAEMCDIVYSCHLFEFRGILCRHAISVLMRNAVTSLLDRYILRRWRRDICRAHTRVSVNYAGLVSTPDQVRYENMCDEFATLAGIAANNEDRCCEIHRSAERHTTRAVAIYKILNARNRRARQGSFIRKAHWS